MLRGYAIVNKKDRSHYSTKDLTENDQLTLTMKRWLSRCKSYESKGVIMTKETQSFEEMMQN